MSFLGFDATMKPERKENYSMVFDGTDLAYHYEDLTLTDFWLKNAKTKNWNEAVSEHIVKDEQFRMAKRSHDERGVSFQLNFYCSYLCQERWCCLGVLEERSRGSQQVNVVKL